MGAPLVVLIIGFGQQIGLLLLVLAATGQGFNEFCRMTLPKGQRWERTAGIGLALLFPVVAYAGGGGAVLAAVAAAFFVLLLLFTASPNDLDTSTSHMTFILFGVVYVGFLLSHLVLLGGQPNGIRWVLFLLMTVWAGDTCAYFTGSLIGKHRIYPRISPKKSFEGFVGGLAGSIAVALLFRRFFLAEIPGHQAVILAFFILILGHIGDFGESMIKRAVNVKDSSALIPGHGGILDRLDSLLFPAPLVYYYVVYGGSHWIGG